MAESLRVDVNRGGPIALDRTVMTVLPLVWRSLVCCWLVLGLASAGGRYSFSLDGEPFTPHISTLHGELAEIRPGDIARVREHAIVLDGPGEYRFESGKWGRLYRVFGEGKRVLVGMRLRALGRGGAGPAGEEWKDLRSLILSHGWARYADRLKAVDLEHCCLTFGLGTRAADLGGLGKLRGPARYLDLGSCETETLDLPVTALGLRYLRLPQVRTFAASDSLTSLTQLRYLDVSGTAIAHLKAVSGHQELRHIVAVDLPLEELPAAGLPRLELLEGALWNCSREEVKRFRALNENAFITAGATELIRHRTRDASRLRVFKVSLSLGAGISTELSYETTVVEEIQELSRLLVVADRYFEVVGIMGAASEHWVQFLGPDGQTLERCDFVASHWLRASSLGLGRALLEPQTHLLREWMAERGVVLRDPRARDK